MDINVKDQAEFDDLWLVRALRLNFGEREEQYGHPYENYSRIRGLWSIIAGVPLSYTQVCYMMIALKMGRELSTPHLDEDNNVDIAGYIGVLNRIQLRLEEIDGLNATAEGAPEVADEELPEAGAAPTPARASRGGGRAKPRAPKG